MVGTLTCAGCKEVIEERKHIKAQDKFYHEHHFTCQVCRMDLSEVPVYTRDEKLYCEGDYKAQFLPVCTHCSGYIEEDCLKALGRLWHPEHFQCCSCHSTIAPHSSYRSKGCYAMTVLPKCSNCTKPIM